MNEQLENDKISCLPPKDVRLLTDDDKIITPIDERGLVDIPLLIREVKQSVHSSYEWPVDETNVHHFYWPAVQYPHVEFENIGVNTAQFRNQAINKGRLPLLFHNWLHRVTVPPPVPEIKVIEYSTEAWNVTRSLFYSVKNARHWQRKSERIKSINLHYESVHTCRAREFNDIDIDAIEHIMDKHFIGIEECREKLGKVHPEFQLISPNDTFEDMVRYLGKIMAPSALTLTRFATTTN